LTACSFKNFFAVRSELEANKNRRKIKQINEDHLKPSLVHIENNTYRVEVATK
jgi:hypothetical protein